MGKELSKDVISEDGDDYHGLIVKQANEKWGTDYENGCLRNKKSNVKPFMSSLP